MGENRATSAKDAQSLGNEKRGLLAVVGIGPGAAEWITPEAADLIARADDLIGYAPYLARIAERAGQRRHASDNRVELDRARLALNLAERGRSVVIVSGGDPGVFAMAAALYEALDAAPEALSARIDLRIAPGITAMQAAAARLGAPLGHDFCAISLSDNLKPWPLIERRLRAACAGDFVIALYNPASKARPKRIFEAFALLRALKPANVPIAFARAVGRPDEHISIARLEDADPACVDMATLVLIGSNETRWVKQAGRSFLYTPRSAPAS